MNLTTCNPQTEVGRRKRSEMGLRVRFLSSSVLEGALGCILRIQLEYH